MNCEGCEYIKEHKCYHPLTDGAAVNLVTICPKSRVYEVQRKGRIGKTIKIENTETFRKQYLRCYGSDIYFGRCSVGDCAKKICGKQCLKVSMIDFDVIKIRKRFYYVSDVEVTGGDLTLTLQCV